MITSKDGQSNPHNTFNIYLKNMLKPLDKSINNLKSDSFCSAVSLVGKVNTESDIFYSDV